MRTMYTRRAVFRQRNVTTAGTQDDKSKVERRRPSERAQLFTQLVIDKPTAHF